MEPDPNRSTRTPAPIRRTPTFWVILAVVAAVGGLFGYDAWAYAHPSVDQYAAVVAAVAAGRVNGDDVGHVALPRAYAGLTPRDEAFLTRRPDGSFVLVLPTGYGKGTAMDGLLYSSRPLAEADTYQRVAAVGGNRRFITVGNYPRLFVERRVDDHWYRVSYGKH